MSFKDIEIKTEYRSGKSNVIGDFYIPVLSHAVKYQRAVGFFSSTALIQIARGISELVSNGGKIQLIVSPRLSKEDIYVYIDLKGLGVGTHAVDIMVRGNDPRVEYLSSILKMEVEIRQN